MDLLRLYPKPSNLFAVYNPSLQGNLSNSKLSLAEIALNSNIPSLALISTTYGRDIAIEWMKIQFASINEYAGQGKGASDAQLIEMCQLLLGEYYWMNLAEICKFISLFKLGEYGKFYESIDPMTITHSLRTYIGERYADIERYEREQERIRRQKEIEERGKNGVTYAQYLEMKARGEIPEYKEAQAC